MVQKDYVEEFKRKHNIVEPHKRVSDLLKFFIAVGYFWWFLTEGFFVVFVAIVAGTCAIENVKRADQIKKSLNWAYFIGFCFGLLGWLGYWIYYKRKLKVSKKKITRKKKAIRKRRNGFLGYWDDWKEEVRKLFGK